MSNLEQEKPAKKIPLYQTGSRVFDTSKYVIIKDSIYRDHKTGMLVSTKSPDAIQKNNKKK